MKYSISLFFRIISIVGIILISINFCICQNLVKNPSFEQSKVLQFVEGVNGATHGENSIRKFNGSFPGWSCPDWLGVPSVHSIVNKNEIFTIAQDGKNAIGLTTYAPASDDHNFHAYDYVDFLVGSFDSALVKNQNYYIEFWIKKQPFWPNKQERTVCCTSKNQEAVMDTSHVNLLVEASNFGVLLIADSLDFVKKYAQNAEGRSDLQKVEPHFNYCDLLEIDTGWVKIQGVFTAPFFANHFAMGNFYSAKETVSSIPENKRKIFKLKSNAKIIKDERHANYFIDNILVRKATSLEFEIFKDNNCLLRTRNKGVVLDKTVFDIYQPTFTHNVPQRSGYLGNYDLAFSEEWADCLGDFKNEYVDSLMNSGYALKDAYPVIVGEAKNYDILCINEAHVHSEHRSFLYNLLDSLHAVGYRYLFLEALNSNISIAELNNRKNDPKINWGAYIRDPTLASVIVKARNLGMKIFPYEPKALERKNALDQLLLEFPSVKNDSSGWYLDADGTKHSLAMGELNFSARDRAMANNISSILTRLPPGKAIVYGGGGHMDIAPCRYQFSMAYWLKKLMDKPLLSINQNTLPEISNLDFKSSPVVICKANNYFYNTKICYEKGNKILLRKNDISIIHSFYNRENQERPNWLKLNGDRNKVKVKVPDNLQHPFVALVFEKEQNIKFDVPIDAVEYNEEIEEIEIFIPLLNKCYFIVFISEKKIEKISKCF